MSQCRILDILVARDGKWVPTTETTTVPGEVCVTKISVNTDGHEATEYSVNRLADIRTHISLDGKHDSKERRRLDGYLIERGLPALFNLKKSEAPETKAQVFEALLSCYEDTEREWDAERYWYNHVDGDDYDPASREQEQEEYRKEEAERWRERYENAN